MDMPGEDGKLLICKLMVVQAFPFQHLSGSGLCLAAACDTTTAGSKYVVAAQLHSYTAHQVGKCSVVVHIQAVSYHFQLGSGNSVCCCIDTAWAMEHIPYIRSSQKCYVVNRYLEQVSAAAGTLFLRRRCLLSQELSGVTCAHRCTQGIVAFAQACGHGFDRHALQDLV